ncbi:MAG: helix-turn-helix domain-containing protein [Pseudomonadota bacterium]
MDAFVTTDAKGRRNATDPCNEPCAIERGMRILGGKWTGSILWHLRAEPVRFNDLSRMIQGASKKMIADRLKHLEAYGLISRHVRDTSPVSVEYCITAEGKTALQTLDALRLWAEERAE